MVSSEWSMGSGKSIYSHIYVYLELLTFDAICHVGAENGSRSGGAVESRFHGKPLGKESGGFWVHGKRARREAPTMGTMTSSMFKIEGLI